MTSLDIAVLLIYVVGITAFGALFYKRSSTPDGFCRANSRLPGWVVGLSIFGTYLSSISFLALPGKSYVSNWNAFCFSLSLPFAAYVATRWFAPLYRSTDDVSAYAYLERRFGLWARLYAMTFYLLTQVARVGTILFLVALALERLTGWHVATIIVVAGIIIIFYTVIGGIEAVIWTDAIQSVILTIGALICATLLLLDMPEGPSQLLDIAADNDKFSLGSMSPDFTTATFWVVFLYGIVINLQNFGIDQSYVQRYQASRSLHEAKKSIWIGALTYLPVSALFLFVGTGLFAFYGAQPELLPAELSETGMADRIFPYFIVTQLPSGITGLLIAALFAAAMSSVDSSLNSSATILMTDIYERFVNPGADDTKKIKFLRIVTIVFGLLGIVMALFMISVKGTLDAWWSLAGIFSGGMAGLFLLGAFSRKARSKHAMAGVIVGLVYIVWATFSDSNPLHTFMTAVIGTTTIIVVGALLSQRQKPLDRAKPARTVDDLHGE